MVALLLDRLGKPWSLVRQVEDRPGHDRRYAMDGSKLAALGWRPATSFEDGLASTVDWYRANEAWWRAARSGDWDGWYERQYGRRLATGEAAPAAIPRAGRPGAGRLRDRPARLMRVAVTGAAGRLGSALVEALADAPFTGPAGPLAWARDAFDLDAPDAIGGRLDRERPEVVVHAAAWTDVDGCALDPDLAMQRNGVATASWPRPARRAGSTSSSSRPTRSSPAPPVDGRPHGPDRPDRPAQSVWRGFFGW